MNKLIAGVVILILVSGAGIWAGREYLRTAALELFHHAPKDKKFMTAWEQDLQKLKETKSLHPGFANIKRIQIFSQSDKMKKMFKKYPIDFGVDPNGRYTLEIFMDEIEEGGGVVIQYDLVENKTGNTIWEMGRTFPHKLEK